jgi:hypothetical protein
VGLIIGDLSAAIGLLFFFVILPFNKLLRLLQIIMNRGSQLIVLFGLQSNSTSM